MRGFTCQSAHFGMGAAWEALFRDQDALPGGSDRVLIVGGAGGVGSLATQLLEARTTAFVISTELLESHRSIGKIVIAW